MVAGNQNDLQAALDQLLPTIMGVGTALGLAVSLEQNGFAAIRLGPGGQHHSAAQGLSRIGGDVAGPLQHIGRPVFQRQPGQGPAVPAQPLRQGPVARTTSDTALGIDERHLALNSLFKTALRSDSLRSRSRKL